MLKPLPSLWYSKILKSNKKIFPFFFLCWLCFVFLFFQDIHWSCMWNIVVCTFDVKNNVIRNVLSKSIKYFADVWKTWQKNSIYLWSKKKKLDVKFQQKNTKIGIVLKLGDSRDLQASKLKTLNEMLDLIYAYGHGHFKILITSIDIDIDSDVIIQNNSCANHD